MRNLGLTAYEEFLDRDRCPECSGDFLNLGEELTCSSCGLVPSEQYDGAFVIRPTASIIATQSKEETPLGSVMGKNEDRRSEEMFNDHLTIGVAKMTSDRITTPDRDALWACAMLIERASGVLSIPKHVMKGAMSASRKLLAKRKEYHASIAAISAVSLIVACRTMSINRINVSMIMRAYSETGHVVTRSQIMRMGDISSIFARVDNDPSELAEACVKTLMSDEGILERVREARLNERAYFIRLLDLAKMTIAQLHFDGFNPRTVAAACVYSAGVKIGPKVFKKKEVCRTIGASLGAVENFWGRIGRS